MRVIVLGRYGPYPRAGGATSGYLIEDGQTRVLVDCGAGVYARLIERCMPWQLDAVILTHLHFDHCSDVNVLGYAMADHCGADGPKLDVYAPEEPMETAASIKSARALEVHAICDKRTLEIGSLKITFHAVRHPVPTYAVDITGENGRRLFYTSDTGYFSELACLARGANALLADACFTGERAWTGLAHMSAKQVSHLAFEAGVDALYATHLWGGADNEQMMKKEIDFTPAVVVQERGQYEV